MTAIEVDTYQFQGSQITNRRKKITSVHNSTYARTHSCERSTNKIFNATKTSITLTEMITMIIIILISASTIYNIPWLLHFSVTIQIVSLRANYYCGVCATAGTAAAIINSGACLSSFAFIFFIVEQVLLNGILHTIYALLYSSLALTAPENSLFRNVIVRGANEILIGFT